MKEGEPVGVLAGLQCRFMHQSADGEVRHQQTVEFLPYQIRRLAAQNNLSATQMRFEFVQGDLSGKGAVLSCLARFQPLPIR